MKQRCCFMFSVVLNLPRIQSLNLQHTTTFKGTPLCASHDIQGNPILSIPCRFPAKVVSENKGTPFWPHPPQGLGLWQIDETPKLLNPNQNLKCLEGFKPIPPKPKGKGKGQGKGKGNYQSLTSGESMKHVYILDFCFVVFLFFCEFFVVHRKPKSAAQNPQHSRELRFFLPVSLCALNPKNN